MKLRALGISLLLGALLTAVISAQPVSLDGRIVVLLISQHRKADAETRNIRRSLMVERHIRGAATESMPVVYMGFLDSDADNQHFERLGFKVEDAPVLCAVRWGSPEDKGPQSVVPGTVRRNATEIDVVPVLRAAFAAENEREGGNP